MKDSNQNIKFEKFKMKTSFQNSTQNESCDLECRAGKTQNDTCSTKARAKRIQMEASR